MYAGQCLHYILLYCPKFGPTIIMAYIILYIYYIIMAYIIYKLRIKRLPLIKHLNIEALAVLIYMYMKLINIRW
jgi:hypothetical protein